MNIDKLNNKQFRKIIKESTSFALTVKNIIKTYGFFVQHRHIVSRAQRLNLDISHFTPEKHKLINHNIFKQVGKKEQAYWLGYLMADGYVSKKRNRVSIHINSRDKELLDNFISFTNSHYLNPTYYINSQYKSSLIKFSITSPSMVKDLEKLGCISPKEKNIELPSLKNKSLILAFLLGYYDGDGSEHKPVICSCSKKFLIQVKAFFKIKSDLKKDKRSNKVYNLYIGYNLIRKMLFNYQTSLIRKRKFLTGFGSCFDCKNPIGEKSKRCSSCSMRKPTKFQVNKETLKQLVLTKPITTIGSDFGVSDNAIRKRCKSLGIEVPKFPPGHWLKKQKNQLSS